MANTASAAQVQQYLENVSYPCSKDDLIDAARNEGADEEVMDLLQSLPEGEYHSPIDISKAIGEMK
ncbi:MAG TPA: DUF2795 domain-containing protein [Candidatus Paceibacterota bacterium]|nr:DUF2795 domain-containing protein [Candidatus Paceibacterota bacterium]